LTSGQCNYTIVYTFCTYCSTIQISKKLKLTPITSVTVNHFRQLVLHSKAQFMPSQPVVTDRWAGDFDCCACRRKRLTADEFSKRVGWLSVDCAHAFSLCLAGVVGVDLDGKRLLWTSGWGLETREFFSFPFYAVMKQR
jgi:hypothetical protein